MSFFNTLKTDFYKLFKKTPSEIHLALAVITYAAPIVEGILAVVDPSLVPVVQPIVTRLETGLATAYSLANEGTASGATLGTTLVAVSADLSQIESVAGIKDAATQAKISTVITETEAVIALLPTSAAAVAAGVAAAA